MLSYPHAQYIEFWMDYVYFADERTRRADLDRVRRDFPNFRGAWKFRRSQMYPQAVHIVRWAR